MTKQDFEALAALIKANRNFLAADLRDYSRVINDGFDNLARDMAQYMAIRNPSFDQSKFLTAAGVS